MCTSAAVYRYTLEIPAFHRGLQSPNNLARPPDAATRHPDTIHLNPTSSDLSFYAQRLRDRCKLRPSWESTRGTPGSVVAPRSRPAVSSSDERLPPRLRPGPGNPRHGPQGPAGRVSVQPHLRVAARVRRGRAQPRPVPH